MNRRVQRSLLAAAWLVGLTGGGRQAEAADLTPPTGSVVIDGEAEGSAGRLVTLTLAARDDNGPVTQMELSNTGTFSGTGEPYAATKAWRLTSGDGLKTVSVRFRDEAGNWCQPMSDTIRLDTTPPPLTVTSPSDGAVLGSST